MHAVRNIRLCTKDCLCLYVCPTGATDTETGQIDAGKCRDGCRLCVDACPSHAISLVPDDYPPQQKKKPSIRQTLYDLAEDRVTQAQAAATVVAQSQDPVERQLAEAIRQSSQLMAEDLLREAGYLLPQSPDVRTLLLDLKSKPQTDGFPLAAVDRLLQLIPASTNQSNSKEEKTMLKYRCTVCGFIYEGELPAGFVCPVCKAPASAFVLVSEKKEATANRYAGTKTEKNLAEAFAGESQARNKYTYLLLWPRAQATTSWLRFSSRPPATSKSTPASGTMRSATLAAPPKTSSMQPKAKTTSGPTCTIASPKTPLPKASRNWLPVSVPSLPLKKRTKSATALY